MSLQGNLGIFSGEEYLIVYVTPHICDDVLPSGENMLYFQIVQEYISQIYLLKP